MGTYRTGGFSLTRWVSPLVVRIVIDIFRLLDHRPRLMRAVTACLRVRPVWNLGKTVLVTGDRQVRDVLKRDDDFPLPEKRASKFLTGAFVLGMTRTRQFTMERGELERVVRRADADRIRQLSARCSEEAITRVAPEGQLDVIEDLTTPVGGAVIQEYFGVRVTAELLDDLRLLGAMIASPKSELASFRQMAEQAAVRVFSRIEEQIEETESKLKGCPELCEPATVLQRLVFRKLTGDSRFDCETIRRNITGVLLPGSALVARAFATGVVQLLKKKALRDGAVKAAAIDDLARLEGYLLEAIRFHPVFPVVPRYCPRDTALPGFNREYRVAAGKAVYAIVASAMFDPNGAAFEGPTAGYPFEARLRDPRHYTHFGGGAHECLGQHIALPQMVAMLSALLKLPRLDCRKIVYGDDIISPSRLRITFAPSAEVIRQRPDHPRDAIGVDLAAAGSSDGTAAI